MKFLVVFILLIEAINSTMIDPSGCRITKGCWSTTSPVFTWKMFKRNSSLWMDIELEGPGDGKGYVAVGFSNYAHKGQDYIIECSKIGDNANLSMKFSWNNDGPANFRIDGEETIEKDYFAETSFKTVDNVAYCKGSVKIDGWHGSNLVLNVTNGTAYYFKYAYGTTNVHGLIPHQATATLASWGKIDLAGIVGETREARGPPADWKLKLKQAHGILMVLSWICFIPSAMLFARFLRGSWPGVKPGGLLIWFHVHRTANMVGIVLMTASFICIMTAFEWKWTGPGSGAKYAYRVHSMLGLLALILAWIQPLNSILRCGPNDSRRPWFNWSHRIIGACSYILATAALATAAYMFQSPSGVWTIAIQLLPGLKLALVLIPPAITIGLMIIFPFIKPRENTKDNGATQKAKEVIVFAAIAIFVADSIALSVMIVPLPTVYN